MTINKKVCGNCLRPDMCCNGSLCGTCQASIKGVTDPDERTRILAATKERLQGKGKMGKGSRRAAQPVSGPIVKPVGSGLKPFLTREPAAQIIPVTLRLTIEVNVRVNAQGCN